MKTGVATIHTTLRRIREVLSYKPQALVMATIVLASALVYTAGILLNENRYHLADSSVRLIGNVNTELAKKVTLDKNLNAYRFNAENIAPDMTNESDPAKVAALLASQKQQSGGGGKETKNLYSLDLPIDPKKGTTVYDSNSKTSFKLIPQFGIDTGRSEQGRVVYPLEHGGQAVYSVKNNGVKEDIVLMKPRGDALSFSYKLELPKTLQARLDDRGNLGIYGIDPAITSAMATASSDTARLKDIQENGTKTHLAYLIPAPTILQSGGNAKTHTAKATYKLDGNILTVSTSGLEKLIYPISIDPSVVVTSTADFAKGNNEGNINFDTDAISRAAPTNGSIASWTSTTPFTTARRAYASAAYNGRLYISGGVDSSSTVFSDVQYAPINADGSVGAWTATTTLPTLRYGHASAAYNGYLYVIGGYGGGYLSDVQYAPINADGSLGAWTATTSFTTGRFLYASVIYNGYLYITGGSANSGVLSDVQYAPINADGSLGAWTATTSFTTGRSDHTSVAYNGYLYITGGINATSAALSDVQYAPINADGSVGPWTATTSFTTPRSDHISVVSSGYLYIMGGSSSSGALSDVQYAPINADGSVGPWTATTSFTTPRYGHTSIAYNGYLYILGGNSGSVDLNDVQYALLDAVKDISMSAWTATTVLGAGSGSAAAKVTTRANHGSVVYNGYIYLIAGTGVSTTITNVHYAPLNTNGTVGAWATTTSLPAARAAVGAVAINGYLYAIGGQDATGVFMTTAYYAPIAANGTVGAWSTTTALTSGRSDYGLVNYNGYMYATGGVTTGAAVLATVEYAVINANGTLGAWTATTSLPAGRGAHDSVILNGFIYVIGGSVGGSVSPTTAYAPLNANGTVGAWTATTSLPLGRSYTHARIYQGYVFIVGGYQGSSVDTNTSYYAKINSDGTLGSWGTGTAFTTVRESQGVEIYNGYIYITGGWNGTTRYGDVQYAKLNTSLLGTTQTWQARTSLATVTYGHTTVAYNGYLYAMGGKSGTAGTILNTVKYAAINTDGTLGAWTTSANNMVNPRLNGAAAVYNGYLYVTGGQTGTSTYANTVEYAKINADGSVGAWQVSANAFTTARFGHVAAAYGGKLYIVSGGDSGSVALGDAQYATINADGSIGTWAATTSTTAASDTDGFVYGGRLYVTGGYTGSVYLASVRYALINSDGTLGAWTTSTTSFMNGRSRHAAAALNGYIYISGGASASTYGDLQYAPINTNGSIGDWQLSNSVSAVGPTLFYYHTLTAYKGKLYSVAGLDSTNTALTSTYSTALVAPALGGTYSQLVNLGQPSTLNSIVMNGILPPGQTIVQFKVASSNGIFGGWQSTGLPITNVKYVMYKISFDDSNGAAQTATAGRSSVTDVTVNYTLTLPTPDIRLRHNKYFDSNGIQQPLDTSGL